MSSKPTTTAAAGGRKQSTRLQRRAPASLQISPVSSWNVAIPLLSPLATSPTSTEELRKEQRQIAQSSGGGDAEKAKPVFKRWQHPAAPFCYEPTSSLPPFVPV